ncbi:hypothetical protein GQ53DRAFT_712101 [Thozetella sp. PMI_491]|nr:hypothetical protein GQ53DRAFT_712101 [Thozetella sp. PMI_491]
MDPIERGSLVSSLYGPGTTIAWLLTIASVLANWILNVESRKQDAITNDLIAALTLPAVAAAHLIYQLQSLPGSATDFFTSSDESVVQAVAAIEAPLTVCETFSAFALILFPVAAYASHYKQCICVLVVGLLSFSTEVILFAKAFGVTAAASNLARPYIFNFAWGIALVLAFLFVSLTGYLGIWAFGPAPRIQDPSIEQNADLKMRYKYLHRQKQSMHFSLMTSAFMAPLSIVFSAASGVGALEATGYQSYLAPARRLTFFIPVSLTSISDLDQAVAIGAGALTLGVSLYEAFQAARRAEDSEITAALKKRLQRLVSYYKDIQDLQLQIESATDPSQRNELESYRQRLLTRVSTLTSSL